MDKNQGQEDGRDEHLLRHYLRLCKNEGLETANKYLAQHAPNLASQAAALLEQLTTVRPSTFASIQSLTNHRRPAGGHGESSDPS